MRQPVLAKNGMLDSLRELSGDDDCFDLDELTTALTEEIALLKSAAESGWRDAVRKKEAQIQQYKSVVPIIAQFKAEAAALLKELGAADASVPLPVPVPLPVTVTVSVPASAPDSAPAPDSATVPESAPSGPVPTAPPTPQQLENRVGFILTLIGKTEFSPEIAAYVVSPPDEPNNALAKQGWGVYAMFSDSEGNLDKASFGKLVRAVFETIYNLNTGGMIPGSKPGQSLAQQLVEGLLAQIKKAKEPLVKAITGTDSPENVASMKEVMKRQDRATAEKFAQKLVDKFWALAPALIDSIYRYFDTDANGSVSKAEFIALVTSCFPVPGESTSVFMDRALAIFRMIDKDSSGTIEPAEFCSVLVTDLYKLVMGLAKVVLTEIFNLLRELVKETPPMSIETSKKLPGWSEERQAIVLKDLLTSSMRVGVAPSMIRQAARQMSGISGAVAAGFLTLAFSTMFSSFLVAFEQSAAPDGTLSKQQVVEIISLQLKATMATCVPIIVKSTWAKLLREFVDPTGEFALGIPPFFDPQAPVKLAPAELKVVVDKLVDAVEKWFRGKGVTALISALVDFCDANNDGSISRDELFGVTKALLSFTCDPTEDTLVAFFMSVFRFFGLADDDDAKDGGKLTDAKLKAFMVKSLGLIEQVYLIVVDALEAAVTEGLPPVVEFAFVVKSLSTLGGSKTSLTLAELKAGMEKLGFFTTPGSPPTS